MEDVLVGSRERTVVGDERRGVAGSLEQGYDPGGTGMEERKVLWSSR